SFLAKALPPERVEALLSPAVARAFSEYLKGQRYPTVSSLEYAKLVALAEALPANRAGRLLIEHFWLFSDADRHIASSLLSLATRASLEQQVEWLKHPLCYGNARAAILSQVKTSDGKTFRTLWELVEWLRKDRPNIDLSAPPKLD